MPRHCKHFSNSLCYRGLRLAIGAVGIHTVSVILADNDDKNWCLLRELILPQQGVLNSPMSACSLKSATFHGVERPSRSWA
jgi:hypothetical protein